MKPTHFSQLFHVYDGEINKLMHELCCKKLSEMFGNNLKLNWLFDKQGHSLFVKYKDFLTGSLVLALLKKQFKNIIDKGMKIKMIKT